MIILLPAIKHTGSHFVLKKLLNGFTCINLKDAEKTISEGDNTDKNMVVFDHVFPEKFNLWDGLIYRYPSIVPLRKKDAVWESWKKRSSEPDKKLFDYMWWYIETILWPTNPFFINLDNERTRDKQLDRINLLLELDLKADGWPIVRK